MDRRAQRPFAIVAVAVLALAAASCGGDGNTVDVTLQEFSIGTDPTSGEAGDFTFEATNDGPDDTHEFVVFKTDLALTDLPTDENGAVIEDGEGVELMGEIEDIEVGDTKSVTLSLDAGAYVFVCNIWDEEEQEAHYQEGMRTSFTVS
ncbi:MAG TPA: hypothetical protein VFQ40_09965 [Actinomycetota bacterium]|nr:hypothetical protein [Actinomycetota bacterium]